MPEFIMLAVIGALGIAAYWALVLFPRQRDFQKRQRMARSLSAGDEVITAGGIIGKIQGIDAEKGIAHIEIADNVVVKLVTAAIIQAYDPEEIAKNARMGLDEPQTETA
jgi:preprotein translocase subunit YajC